MSGGGGGIIIIQNLIDNPGVPESDKDRLRDIQYRMRQTRTCDWMDRMFIRHLVSRLLKQP